MLFMVRHVASDVTSCCMVGVHVATSCCIVGFITNPLCCWCCYWPITLLVLLLIHYITIVVISFSHC